jgi:hypothetical protein
LETELLLNMDRKLDDLLRQGAKSEAKLEEHSGRLDKIDERLDSIDEHMVTKEACADRHGVPLIGASAKRKDRAVQVTGWFVTALLACLLGILASRWLGSNPKPKTDYSPFPATMASTPDNGPSDTK